MNEKQSDKLVGIFVEHRTEFLGLSTEDAQWAIQNPKDAVALSVEAIKNRKKGDAGIKPEPLLGSAVNIAAIPRTEQFVVEKSFAKYRGSNFNNWCLGRVEGSIGGVNLYCQPLKRNSTDPAIIEALGGNLEARIYLADIDYAKNSGVLRKDVVCIGYIEDEVRFSTDESFSYINEKGECCVLRVVSFYWHSDGWAVYACLVDDPDDWYAGHLVFSRKHLVP